MAKKSQGSLDVHDRLREALTRLERSRLHCLDLETSGLDWRRCHVVGWVLTFSPKPQDSYYLPFRHAPGGNIGGQKGPQDRHGWDGNLHPAEQQIVKLLEQPGQTTFGHHLAFDLKFGWRCGMTRLLSRFEDTMINAPMLDEWQRSFSLDACARLAGVEAKKMSAIKEHICRLFPNDATVDGKDDKAPMAHFWRLAGDDPVAVEYAAGDGTTTWQLRDWQMKEIEREDLTTVFDVESRLIPVLARMTIRGIRIDEDRLAFLIEKVDARINRLLEAFPADFNPRSSNDVEKWCRDAGRTDWPRTPGSIKIVTQKHIEDFPALQFKLGERQRVPQPSFPEEWLETFQAGKAVVDIRKLRTLRDSFLVPMRDTHVYKGRVHTEFHQLHNDEYGTITGRLSSSGPNLQAVSKHDRAIGSLHRSIFIPDEGKVWASVDYSQIEPRLLAFYGDVKVLLDGYRANPPVDAHTAVSMMARRDWHEMTPEQRKDYRNNFGKRINQTVITGGGKNALVKKYKMTEQEAVEMLDLFYTKVMPELRPLQKRKANLFRTRGYLISLLGRRARLNDPGKDYTAMNRLLQCGNADIIKLKLVEIDEFLESIGRPVDLLNNIHDDIAYQFPESARPVYQECLRIMTRFGPDEPIDLDGIPVEIEAGEGQDWAQATYGAPTVLETHPTLFGVKDDGIKKR